MARDIGTDYISKQSISMVLFTEMTPYKHMSGIKKLLIANRGECAIRIQKTCKKLNIKSVAVYTECDATSLHCREAWKCYQITSYTDPKEYINVAKISGADAIHPGYGFLAESHEFARMCKDYGIVFVGPRPDSIQAFGSKERAKKLAIKAGVPVLKGSGILYGCDEAVDVAKGIGYPVLLKAVVGGGGIGIQLCKNIQELVSTYDSTSSLAEKTFGVKDLMVEKYLPSCRHIEVQVFGDGEGNVIVLGERECSVQRRHQKVIEESPAPGLSQEMRTSLCEAARRICVQEKYDSCGTVEFLVDGDTFYFCEMNTRLQVEHGVTELRYGIDLVEWMIRQSSQTNDADLPINLQPIGHAIEIRIYAEDCARDFRPCAGIIQEMNFPVKHDGFRIDTGVTKGCNISPFYDPMIAKVLQWGATRDKVITNLKECLLSASIDGPPNNLDYVTEFLSSDAFVSGDMTTNVLREFHFTPRCFEVISPGLFTTVQNCPGRVARGLWRVGIPPSGAMDHLACRLANRLAGNDETTAVLETTFKGPTLKFYHDSLVAVTGPPVDVKINGVPGDMWQSIKIKTGDVVSVTGLTGNIGCRSYIAIRGGINVAPYLGSKATFPNGAFGGYQGRKLENSDMIKVGALTAEDEFSCVLDHKQQPSYTNDWKVGVLPGPYANPDYFTDKDIDMFYSTKWAVHHDSNRLGIRLVGPSPSWARQDGGEGGSHPSNVHDYVYAIGSVNFTGNMPIIIAHDGPSLGGFVCPCTIVESELWKLGQLSAGDTIQFVQMTIDEANQQRFAQNRFIADVGRKNESTRKMDEERDLEISLHESRSFVETQPILYNISPSQHHPGMTIRLSGDKYILVEYGTMVLDLNLRFRVHFLEKELLTRELHGLEETAPGVRSLQIRYEPFELPLKQLLRHVCDVDTSLPDITSQSIPIRVIRLPMCFDYSGVDEAIKLYTRRVRPEAPYLPSNIEFIAKNNGLSSIQEVKDKMFAASYMCLGLGDVYLGAPCAVPTNPLHRMVNPKYNPARTYTQEGTVGLGGTYMCIYPMDSPGGYQLVGRTLPIWNTYATGSNLFHQDKPWLLEMFDQVRFFEVSEEELDFQREEFKQGKLDVHVTSEVFNIEEYNHFLSSIKEDVDEYKHRQRTASEIMNVKEKNSLARLASLSTKDVRQYVVEEKDGVIKDGEIGVYANFKGVVGKVCVRVEDKVTTGCVIIVLEAMKMESSCCSPCDGKVTRLLAVAGDVVDSASLLAVIRQ